MDQDFGILLGDDISEAEAVGSDSAEARANSLRAALGDWDC